MPQPPGGVARTGPARVVVDRHGRAFEAEGRQGAWKKAVSPKQLEELGEKFEDIEHAQFGEDGFELAVRQMSGIEDELGLGDVAKFTAAAPPKGA